MMDRKNIMAKWVHIKGYCKGLESFFLKVMQQTNKWMK